MFHCYHQSIVLCCYSHCAVTVILLCHSCDRPFSCYFTTIMLLSSHSAALLSSDFADVIQLCYSQAFPQSYCFASVILLCQCHFTLPVSFYFATVMILCQSCCCSASVTQLCQSCCLPISCYIANITKLATVRQTRMTVANSHDSGKLA